MKELLIMFIENVDKTDLVLTIIGMALIVIIDIILFTHPMTRDYFTEEIEEREKNGK